MHRKTPRRGITLTIIAGLMAAFVALPGGSASGAAAKPPAPPPPGVNLADCPGGALAAHAPIAINTDADWSPANGVTRGSGTPTDPYVISCWSIQGTSSATSSAISVAQAAGDKAFTVRDVQLTGAAGSLNGLSFSATNATVTRSTISKFTNGIHYGGQTTTLTSNLLTGNQVGAAAAGSQQALNASGNYVTASGGQCLNLNAAAGLVTNNTCIDNPGTGFTIQGAADPSKFIASGNLAQGNGGYGFSGAGLATLRANTAKANSYGIVVFGPSVVVDRNLVEGNRSGGIDITGGSYSTISNNVISNNGGPGITADPANAQGELGSDNTIVGNHIGGNPYGIIFFGPQPANLVQQTDWTDGAQSITDFADQSSVVDAGSSKRAGVGQPVLFSDYLARLTMEPGSAPPTSPVPGVSTGNLAPPNPQAGAVTGISWNFGDGSAPVSVSDPTQGHGPAPQVSHTYAKAGTYTATLTVTGTNSAGHAVSLTDTVPVYVAAPAKAAKTTECAGVSQGPGKASPAPAGWPMLGDGPARTFCNPTATITPSNVNQLVPKWRFPTAASVTASPAVATVPVGGTPTQMVYDGDFDGMFYALNTNTGLPVWSACLVKGAQPAPVCNPQYPTNPTAQVDYGTIVASPAVATVGSSQRVFEAANATMWSLDAATGKVAWSFDGAGHSGLPNYEIEASPLVVASPTGEQLVVFSIDCNGFCDKPGGVYGVDAADGHLVWFFDPVGGANYQPTSKTITSFAPTDTGPASAGDGACGGIWTSQAADVKLGLLFTSTADCPQQPMQSPYYEAAFALNLATGAPVWHYQPRSRDAADMDFGATPNVYTIQGAKGPAKDVVGFGSKDGTYSLLDAASGTVQWVDKLTVGGNFGGFYNSATDGSRVYLTSALGTASGTTVSAADEATKGRVWAIDAATGAVNWVQDLGAPTLGQNSVIPGVYFNTGLDHAVHAYSTDTGAPLAMLPTGGAVSSGPAIVGDQLFVGAGTGSTWRAAVGTCLDPINAFGECESASAVLTAPVPMPVGEYGQGIWGFCVATDPTCVSHGGSSGLPSAPAG